MELKVEILTEKIIKQLIEGQTKNLAKAIIELYQNARDSVLNTQNALIEISIDSDKLIVRDNGIGFNLEKYAIIGLSEKQAGAIGKFGVGRLQILQFADAEYQTANQNLSASWDGIKLKLNLTQRKSAQPGVLAEFVWKDRMSEGDLRRTISNLNESLYPDKPTILKFENEIIQLNSIESLQASHQLFEIQRDGIKMSIFSKYFLSQVGVTVIENGIAICKANYAGLEQYQIFVVCEGLELTMDRSTISGKNSLTIGIAVSQALYQELTNGRIPAVSANFLEFMLETASNEELKPLPPKLQISGLQSGRTVSLQEIRKHDELYDIPLAQTQRLINQGFDAAFEFQSNFYRYLTGYEKLSIKIGRFAKEKLESLFPQADKLDAEPLYFWQTKQRTRFYYCLFLLYLHTELDSAFGAYRAAKFVSAADFAAATDSDFIYYNIDVLAKDSAREDKAFKVFTTVVHEFCHEEDEFTGKIEQHTTVFYENWMAKVVKHYPIFLEGYKLAFGKSKSAIIDYFLDNLDPDFEYLLYQPIKTTKFEIREELLKRFERRFNEYKESQRYEKFAEYERRRVKSEEQN